MKTRGTFIFSVPAIMLSLIGACADQCDRRPRKEAPGAVRPAPPDLSPPADPGRPDLVRPDARAPLWRQASGYRGRIRWRTLAPDRITALRSDGGTCGDRPPVPVPMTTALRRLAADAAHVLIHRVKRLPEEAYFQTLAPPIFVVTDGPVITPHRRLPIQRAESEALLQRLATDRGGRVPRYHVDVDGARVRSGHPALAVAFGWDVVRPGPRRPGPVPTCFGLERYLVVREPTAIVFYHHPGSTLADSCP